MGAGIRALRVLEGVGIAIGAAAMLGAVSIARTTERQESAIGVLEVARADHETRIDTIEGGAFVVQLAQATDRLEKLEDAADQTAANAVAIEGIRSTQTAQGGQLERIESSLTEQTRLIIRAMQGPRSSSTPAATTIAGEVEPPAAVTSEPPEETGNPQP